MGPPLEASDNTNSMVDSTRDNKGSWAFAETPVVEFVEVEWALLSVCNLAALG